MATVTFLGPADMHGLISMAEAVEAAEEGFRQWATDPQIGGLRRRVHAPSGVRVTLHQGGAPETGVTGITVQCELVRIDPEGHQLMPVLGTPVRVVYDANTAELLAILAGDPRAKEIPNVHSLMGIPTAAASTVGTKLLARQDSREVGLLGSGIQARYHLAATCAVRPIKRVRVYSPTPAHREEFAAEMSRALDVEIVTVESPREAVSNTDIVLLMTDTNVPALDGNWLATGSHVVSVVWSDVGLVRRGQTREKRRELDDTTLRRAAVVATNALQQVEFDQGGDLYDTMQRGVLDGAKLVDVGQLLRGDAPGRTADDQITVFKNCSFWGMADQVIANLLVQRARERGLGTELTIPAAAYRDRLAAQSTAH